MEVILAKSAGFCFGVKRAVNEAYEHAQDGNVYTYGPIIHNEEVVKDLEEKGVVSIDEEDIPNLPKDSTVIIRSHGAKKEIYDKLEANNIKIVDATCPFVLKIHKIVKEASKDKQVIIVGNENHPEVLGICGWCINEPIVVDSIEKAEKLRINDNKDICVVSQTTFNSTKFKEIVEIISKKGYNINVCNTICNATEERQTEARALARMADAMIVIGGKSSSNTQKLYEICKSECENTSYIQTLSDLDMSKLKHAKQIGITAGASTPNNIIQEVHTNVRFKF